MSSAITRRSPEDEKPAQNPQLQKHFKQYELNSHRSRLYNTLRAPFLQIQAQMYWQSVKEKVPGISGLLQQLLADNKPEKLPFMK